MTKQKSHRMISSDALKIRENLRKNVLQINKLERLIGLKNLKFIGANTEGKISIIFYEYVAPPELYPDVGEKLIEKEVIRTDNLMASQVFNKGQHNEYEEVRMSLDFSTYGAWVFLRAYNPDYKISPNAKILKTNLLIHYHGRKSF